MQGLSHTTESTGLCLVTTGPASPFRPGLGAAETRSTSRSCLSFPCASPLSWIAVPRRWSGLRGPLPCPQAPVGPGEGGGGLSAALGGLLAAGAAALQAAWPGPAPPGTHLPSQALEIGPLTQGPAEGVPVERDDRPPLAPAPRLPAQGPLPRARWTRSFRLTRRSWYHSLA